MIITPEQFSDDWREDQDHGLELERRPNRQGFAYSGFAKRWDDADNIARHEWQARVEEFHDLRNDWFGFTKSQRINPKNQARTNYCWIFAPTHAAELITARQQGRHISLSPASAGARIKKFRNVGGWGKEAIEHLAEYGATPSRLWPDTAIARNYDTQQTREAARKHRVQEWVELQPRNLDQLFSALLRGLPVACGYNWWRHEIVACDPLWIDNGPAIRIRNSWANWGDYGFGILQGSKMLPDDAVAPISTTLTGSLLA